MNSQFKEMLQERATVNASSFPERHDWTHVQSRFSPKKRKMRGESIRRALELSLNPSPI
jgi:hypothetical protein